MTPEAQNRAIHEFIGGNRFVGLKKRGLWYRPAAKGYTSDESQAGRYSPEEAKTHESVHGDHDDVTIVPFGVPNYTGSLDAMHEAEAYATEHKITGWYWDAYWDELQSLVGCESFCRFNSCDCRDVLHATAAQKAEAFLRVLGK